MQPTRPVAASPMKMLIPDTSGRSRGGNMKSLSVVDANIRLGPTHNRHATITPLAKPSSDRTFLTHLKDDRIELRPPSPFDDRQAEDEIQNAELVPDDYYGPPALQRFWAMFQNQDSTSRSKRPRPRSPRTTYLSRLRQLARCPEPLGIIRKCETSRIDLHDYEIGNELASAMGESISLIPGIGALNLSSNRISDQAASDVITNLNASPTLSEIDLANNQLNLQAAKALATLVATSRTLVHINLEHNKLNSHAITLLCDALRKNQTVTRLNLSENQFTTAGMFSIASLLAENAKLEELYLSWNKIRGAGGQRIVEAIGYHTSLRVLDLSWNSLNSCSNHSIASALAVSLSNNKVLAHLDISNNAFDAKACSILATALLSNHTVIGLHMVGNQGVVDSRGFVKPLTTPIALQAQHKYCPIKNFEMQQDNQETTASLDTWWPYVDRACWLCGRWSEHRFAWTPSHKIDPKAKVYLHLSIDEWIADEMNRSADMFLLYRMLPPGRTKYFITVEIEVVPGETKRQYVVLKDKRTARILRVHGDDHIFGTLQHVNYIAMTRFEGSNPCHATLPRPGENTVKVLKWDIKKSVFGTRYKESPSKTPFDTDALIAKAYAVDFKHSKVDRIVRDPVRKKELEVGGGVHFKSIANLYRKYCSKGARVALDQVSISWTGFSEFVDDCHLVDENSERCRASDMDNVFVAANLEVTEEAKQQDNPDRSLTRFEFLECIFRIAINKYPKLTPLQALNRLMEEHINPAVPEDPNEFRANFLYKEEISDCFLEYVVLLKDLFTAHSGEFCRVGEPKGMAIQEFATIMENYHVFDEKFKQRDLREPFFASKMILLDEMAPPESLKKLLFFNDFLEMLLRVALIRYPPAAYTIADAAESLQLLFSKHICATNKMLETFQHGAERVRVIGALSRMERRPSKQKLIRPSILRSNGLDNQMNEADTSPNQ